MVPTTNTAAITSARKRGAVRTGVDGRAAVLLDGVAEFGAHPVLDAVGPDHRSSYDDLGERCQHAADLLAHDQERLLQTGLEPADGESDERDCCDDRQRQRE
jgi:hypothetical protein